MNLADINDLILAVTHSDLPIERIEELFALLLDLAQDIPGVIVDDAKTIVPLMEYKPPPQHINCRSWISASFLDPTDDELRALWGEETP